MKLRVHPSVRSIVALTLLTVLGSGFTATRASAAAAEPEELGGSVALKSPYRLIGLLRFFNGKREFLGTGTLVTPKGVLSCAHTMYSSKSGFSFDILFERGRYKTRVLRSAKPTGLTVLSGYVNSVEKHGEAHPDSFARDIALLNFKSELAGGQKVVVRDRLTTLKTEGVTRTSLGYGAATHDGQTLLTVASETAWKEIQPGYYKTRGALLEGGMSGGPTLINLNSVPLLVAVNVSGSDLLSGYRVITPEVIRLIKRHLN